MLINQSTLDSSTTSTTNSSSSRSSTSSSSPSSISTSISAYFSTFNLNQSLIRNPLLFISTGTSYCKMLQSKHCQRHNGPEGWVHITSSNTNPGHISSSESWPSINFKISTKHQPLHKTSASKSEPNLASESWPRFNFITSSKHQQKKNWPNSSFKSCLSLNFKILTKPCAQSLNKSLAFLPNLSFEICNKLLTTRSSSATVTTSSSFELASSHARVTSIKFTKQQWVSELVS